MPTAAHHKCWLIIILAVALLLRVGTAWVLDSHLSSTGRGFLIEGDADGYWRLAQSIADGSEYSIYDPPRRVLRMPGFPAVLAGCIALFGGNLLPARFVLCLVGTLACWLVYSLGGELVDSRVGLIACGLSAAAPVLIGFTPLILSETLFAMLMLASLLAMARLLRLHQHPEVRLTKYNVLLALCTGGLIALACYVRPSWLLAGPLMGVALLLLSRCRKVATCHGVLILAGLLAALLPWGSRNQRVTGHFVLTTLWVGPSLYDGLNPTATGDSDMAFFDRDNLLAEMSEYEMDRHYRAAAWNFVRDNPWRTVRLAGTKLGRFWNLCPNAPQLRSWKTCLAIGGFFLPAVVLAGFGGWRMRTDAVFLLLTIGPILYFTAIHTVFVSSLRYRLPAEYPLLVATAVGLSVMWTRLRPGLNSSTPNG